MSNYTIWHPALAQVAQRSRLTSLIAFYDILMGHFDGVVA
jgi:hypothetical protein